MTQSCHICGTHLPDNCAGFQFTKAQIDRASRHLYRFLNSEVEKHGHEESLVYLYLFSMLVENVTISIPECKNPKVETSNAKKKSAMP